MSDENTVYVGDKELINYINAVLTQFRDYDEVLVKARGRKNIGTAVDVAEISKHNHGAEIADIKTNTLSHEDRKVSEIEIKLLKE